MTISRVNGAGWGVGDKLTSAQANSLDLNGTYALDKRSGQTDTLASVVSCSGAGRIIPTFVAGTDANTSYTAGGGNTVINASSGLTAARNYTLSTTGAIAGDRITVIGGAYDITVIDGYSSTTILVVGTSNSGLNHSRSGDFVFTGTRWIEMRSALGPELLRQLFTSNGTYTVPAGVYRLLVVGCGGGGGGGGGGNLRGASTTVGAGGGGGGGAAMIGATFVNTTPGATFAVTRGTGGAAGSVAAAGSDGTNTTFGSTLTFRGAQGGTEGIGASITPTGAVYVFSPGGGSVSGGVKAPAIAYDGGAYVAGTYTIAGTTPYPFWGMKHPGEGGYGRSGGAGVTGGYSHVSGTTGGSGTTTPGSGGAQGSSGGSYVGGGGGGGGGASAFGDGGAGGAGGNGVSGGAGLNGSSGSAGGVGAGGGGGGAGGNSSVPSGGAGASGGAGGDGVLIVIPIR